MPLMEFITICGIAAAVAIEQIISVTKEGAIPAAKVAPTVMGFDHCFT
jgi:hypothetical protein